MTNVTPPSTGLIWPPDRKIWAGGLAGIIAWGLLSLAAHFGFDVQAIANSILGAGAPDIQGALAGLIALAVAYIVPPSLKDIVKRVDDTVIAVARASDASPASPVAPPMTPATAAAVNEAAKSL